MAMVTPTFEQQYDALRGGCGLAELEGWSSVTLSGGDRQAFLHNFCTNDITRLAPGESCEAFVTNVKGRTIGHGVVSCRTDELVFLGAPGQAPRLIEHLDRYILREEVELRDTTEERNYVVVAGSDLASARFAECFSNGDAAVTPPQLVSWNLVGSDFAAVIELASSESRGVLACLGSYGFILVGSEVFTTARVEAGMPLFGVDFDEHNFPQEVGRDREAISFTKGCYLGQETVARIDALGHVNQRLIGVRFSGGDVPPAGMELLHAAKQAGRVTSAAFSPRLNAPLAIAMVRREANAPGTRLESPIGACEVVPLPIAGVP